MRNVVYFTFVLFILFPSYAQENFNFPSIKSLGTYQGDDLLDFDPGVSIKSIQRFTQAKTSITERSIATIDQLLTRQIQGGSKLYDKCSPGVVLLVSNAGFGSGSIINKTGDILTNWHVIDGLKNIYVCFNML